MIRSWLASVVLAIFLPVFALAQAHKIDVRATGEVTVACDELLLPLELITHGEEFVAVKERNDALMRQLFALAVA